MDQDKFQSILDLIRPSISKLSDLTELKDLSIFFSRDIDIDSKAKEVLGWDHSEKALTALSDKFNSRDELKPETVSDIVRV